MESGGIQTLFWFLVLSLFSSLTSGQPSHYWSFDQSESIASIRDERGAKTLATVTGDGASFTTVYTSKPNNYLTLSRKTSVDLGTFLDCTGNLHKCNEGITISLIARFHPDHSSESIIKSVSNETTAWSLTREQNRLLFLARHDRAEFRVKMKIKTGVWSQYTFAFNKKSLKVFVNGRLTNQAVAKPLKIKILSVKSSRILLGDPGSHIHADYDDIGIWHRALSTNRVEKMSEKILEPIVLSETCSDVTSSHVCLKWNQREDLYDLVGSIHIQYSDQNIEEIITNRTNVGKKQNMHCIRHLDAEMTYEFRVITILIDGQTQKSNSVRCTTKDGIPAPPVVNDVKVENGTTIVVKWEKPRPTLGTIENYEIKIAAQSEDTGRYKHVRTFPFSGKMEREKTFVLRGLKELTKYKISLTSLGKIGTGRSTVVYANTFKKIDKLFEVNEVYVANTNDREINILWKPLVEVEKAPHLRYKVRYRKYQEKYKTITVLASNITLRGLEEKTAYLINLQPVMDNQRGPWKKQDFLVKTTDRNECSFPIENLCDALAICVNTPNGYICKCPAGYYGDGRVCRRIPPYVTKTHFCQQGNARGLDWPEVYSGDDIVIKCPSGADGFAVRKCYKATIRSYAIFARPDLSRCVSKEIGDLEVLFMDEIGYELDAIMKLKNATRSINLYGGDILRTLEYTEIVERRIFPIKNAEKTLKIIEGITAVSSNLLNIMADNAWHDIPKTKRKSVAEKLIRSLENLAIRYEKTTHNQFNSVQENLVIKTTTLDDSKYFDKPEANETNVYSIQLPIDEIRNKENNANVVFSSYDNIGSYLEQPSNGLSVSRSIISASVVGIKSMTFEDDPVIITVPNPKDSIVTSATCVYWDAVNSTWSSNGCHVNKSDENSTTCHCYHLTNFAVLMSVTPTGTEVLVDSVHAFSLRIITIVCLTISIVVMVIALFTFTCFRFLRSARTSYHRNLVLSLLCASVLFLGGIGQTENAVTCRVVAALLEYFYLVSFVWMAIEGVLLYYMLRKVFKDQKLFKRKLFQASCWLGPAVYVGIFAIVYPENYGTPSYCWLSYEGGFIWSFAAPVLLVILLNTVVVSLAFQIMSERSKDNDNGFKQQVWYWTKGCFVLMFILGITWVFGLLHVANDSIAMAYIFSILNALQGLFIFIFHCLIDPKIRQEYWRILKCQSRSEYNEVNGYSTSMRFRKLSTSMTNSTTLERKPKLLSSAPSSPTKVEKKSPIRDLSPSESFGSKEDEKPLLLHREPSPVNTTPTPSPIPTPTLAATIELPPEPLVASNGRIPSYASTNGYDDEDSIEIVTDNSFSLRSSDESQDTIKELTNFLQDRPRSDLILNPYGEEFVDSPPPLTSEKKPLPRDSVLCEEVFQNEAFSEPWRFSMFERLDAENAKEEEKELEEILKYEFKKPQTIVNPYHSNEDLIAPPPKRKVKEEPMHLEVANPNVKCEKIMKLDDVPPKKPPRRLQKPTQIQVKIKNDQPKEELELQQAKNQPLEKIKNQEPEDEANRMSIPSRIINEIGDVMVEIPVVAQSPPPKQRKRIRSRRRLDNQNNSKSSLDLSDENELSPMQSPSSSSVASSSSGLSSPAFDHESLFKGVDNEIQQDYQTLERKKEQKKKRPTTPTYRAQMEIIQFKPGTALISPQRDVVVNEDGDESLAFEY